jgi:hypothetical protein
VTPLILPSLAAEKLGALLDSRACQDKFSRPALTTDGLSCDIPLTAPRF